MAMVNMKMSAEERTEGDSLAISDREYPYGLEIRLDDDALEKLGITSLPAVGTEVTVTARARVVSTSAYSDKEGESEASCCLQITDMEIGAVAQSQSAASALYGDNA